MVQASQVGKEMDDIFDIGRGSLNRRLKVEVKKKKIENFLYSTSTGNNPMAEVSLLANFWKNIEMASSRVRVKTGVLNGCFKNSEKFINQQLVHAQFYTFMSFIKTSLTYLL